MATETIELTGHIVDSLLLAKVLDVIVDAGVAYELAEVDIGRTNIDPSRAQIELEGEQGDLDRLIDRLQLHGANRITSGTTSLVAADRDGVLPAGFYST
ncbi:MAG: TIGR00300 family protein, partial [Acidimicrobiales bacterium]